MIDITFIYHSSAKAVEIQQCPGQIQSPPHVKLYCKAVSKRSDWEKILTKKGKNFHKNLKGKKCDFFS